MQCSQDREALSVPLRQLVTFFDSAGRGFWDRNELSPNSDAPGCLCRCGLRPRPAESKKNLFEQHFL